MKETKISIDLEVYDLQDVRNALVEIERMIIERPGFDFSVKISVRPY